MSARDEFILIWHPDFPGTKQSPVRRSRFSFENVWKAKGWRIAGETTNPEKGKGAHDG